MATCVCIFSSEGNSGVSGSLTLSQSSEDGPTAIEGQLRGLTPGQRHGVSICTYGDVRDGATSCGAIFNPFGEYYFVFVRCVGRLVSTFHHPFCEISLFILL